MEHFEPKSKIYLKNNSVVPLSKTIVEKKNKTKLETIEELTSWDSESFQVGTLRASKFLIGDQESLFFVYRARGSNNRVPRRHDERQYLEITNRKHRSLAVQDLFEASGKKGKKNSSDVPFISIPVGP